ncbi:MAG: hypothetical protein RIR70_1748 [Pseudomonadota bacterium]
MKHIKHLAVISSLAAATLAQAAPAVQFNDWAKVVSSTPRFEQVNEPRDICRDERVITPSAGRDNTGAVLGGLAGALIGSQVGKGNGRVAAAAVGAATGAIVGDRVGGAGSAASEQIVERCQRVDNWRSTLVGYDVIYEYQGRSMSTFMKDAPGAFLKLHVSVRPD